MIREARLTALVLLGLMAGSIVWNSNGPSTYRHIPPNSSYPGFSQQGSESPERPQENMAPEVTIILPEGTARFGTNFRIPYKIEVTDAEDGASKYGEINTSEVLVEVQYVSASDLKNPEGLKTNVTHPGLLDIASSNCLFCHEFKGKLIGPSFYEIAQYYENSGFNADTILQRIKNGSTGMWGDKVMPSHPELTTEEIKAMLQWINQFASREEIRYYHGLEGILDLQTNEGLISDGVFVITSGYRDHGIDGKSKKTGKDQKVLNNKE